jgi:hypothetical protein
MGSLYKNHNSDNNVENVSVFMYSKSKKPLYGDQR